MLALPHQRRDTQVAHSVSLSVEGDGIEHLVGVEFEVLCEVFDIGEPGGIRPFDACGFRPRGLYSAGHLLFFPHSSPYSFAEKATSSHIPAQLESRAAFIPFLSLSNCPHPSTTLPEIAASGSPFRPPSPSRVPDPLPRSRHIWPI